MRGRTAAGAGAMPGAISRAQGPLLGVISGDQRPQSPPMVQQPAPEAGVGDPAAAIAGVREPTTYICIVCTDSEPSTVVPNHHDGRACVESVSLLGSWLPLQCRPVSQSGRRRLVLYVHVDDHKLRISTNAHMSPQLSCRLRRRPKVDMSRQVKPSQCITYMLGESPSSRHRAGGWCFRSFSRFRDNQGAVIILIIIRRIMN